jgi:hypothetical protein
MPFWGFLGQTKMMRRCARERGVKEVQKSGSGVPYGIEIDDKGRWHPQAPMRNFLGLVASQTGGRKGDGGGECGLLIGVAWGRNGQVLKRN